MKGATMKTRLMLLAFVLLINNGGAWGGDRETSNPAGRSSSKSEASDTENTERNVRDKSDATLTPEDQKESGVDRKIKANIGELARKAAGVKQVKVNDQLEVKGE